MFNFNTADCGSFNPNGAQQVQHELIDGTIVGQRKLAVDRDGFQNALRKFKH